MTDQPLVSIVIVAYENWPDLELAIESALGQSYPSIEVIVVDNSSTDATPEIVPTRYGDRLRYVRQPNSGDAGAYNAGARMARGDFLQFLDGDDVLAPDKIERQMAIFQRHPDTDIAHGDVRNFQSLPAHELVLDHATHDYEDMVAAVVSLDAHCIESPLCALVRRTAFDRIGPWDETVYCTDLDYWLRAAWIGCRFRRAPGLMGFSRMHPGQMSANQHAMRRGTEAVLVKALTYITSEPQRRLIEDLLARHRFMMVVLDPTIERAGALEKLRQVRGRVAPVAYAAGFLTVIAPGGRRLARSPFVGWLRRSTARAIGYRTAGI